MPKVNSFENNEMYCGTQFAFETKEGRKVGPSGGPDGDGVMNDRDGMGKNSRKQKKKEKRTNGGH